MKIYEMNLQPTPFQLILDKTKTIEMRVNDERRKDLKVNDYIVFNRTSDNKKMVCEILGLYYYPTFADLYKHHDKITIGYKEDEDANPDDMLMYYPKEKIDKYGVVGIKIKKLDYKYLLKVKIDLVEHYIVGNNQYELLDGINNLQNLENFLDSAYSFCVHSELSKLKEIESLLNNKDNLSINDIIDLNIHLTIGDIETIFLEELK